MSGPQKRPGNGRDPKNGRFQPGNLANPGGRPRAVPGFTARAKELSLDVLENMAKIATTGRGPAAVQAGALVLAYGEGKPIERMDITARRGDAGAVGGNPDQARQRLEMLIAAAQSGASTVLDDPATTGVVVAIPPLPPAKPQESRGRSRGRPGRAVAPVWQKVPTEAQREGRPPHPPRPRPRARRLGDGGHGDDPIHDVRGCISGPLALRTWDVETVRSALLDLVERPAEEATP